MEYWKFKAIDKLKDYTAKQAAVINIPQEILMLKSKAESIRSATTDGTPVVGGGSAREEMLLSNIVRQEELTAMLKRAKISVKIVDNALDAISEDERYVLEKMYINRSKGAVERLQDEYGLEDARSVYKRADKALTHFTLALYGLTES